MSAPHCHEINLAPSFGGGEAYTRAFTRALLACGIPVSLYVRASAAHWNELNDLPGLTIVRVADAAALPGLLPQTPSWIVTHSPTSVDFLAWAGRRHYLTGFAHMPAFGRDLRPSFKAHDLVFAVSDYVRNGLIEQGILQVHEEPLLGTAELGGRDYGDVPIVGASPYDWDRRKFRDRLLGIVEPLQRSIRPQRTFVRRPGISIGIVSLLSPIKQFPELFRHLAPALAVVPEVNLEIFGSGGYAMVRDMKKSLSPLAGRVRFWGMQRNVGAVYRQLDWLLSGLPEKEALGLNLIEAQSCGTPVLAVDAPPFTETVADEGSGYRYRDPRQDGGADFRRVLAQLRAGERPDPRAAAAAHLERFAFTAFSERVGRAASEVGRRMGAT